ncbi:protein vein-like isoform X2 [Ischnura elegans]|uniref:protein vein-like isoform X2 n=1 Tax=Ischnura elegans TaxID=197161 RepID=UPI001ED876F6|nr:protein vein-like isoform X2 [Ischnura elegans]
MGTTLGTQAGKRPSQGTAPRASAWVLAAMLLVLPALLALGEAGVVCPPHSTSPACRDAARGRPLPAGNTFDSGLRRHHGHYGQRRPVGSAPAAFAGGGGGGGLTDASAEDVASRAYLSPVVFEAKALSRGAVVSGGTYGVTFVVQRVHKGDVRRKSQVRLQFMTPTSEAGTATPATLEGPPQPPGGSWPVQANIRRGGRYVVFAKKIGPHNYSATGEPVQRSRRILAALQDVLCENCVKPPSVSGLKDVALRVKQKLRLVCRTKGNPLPSVAWYKDGQRIQTGKRIRITTKKRRSALVIPRLRLDDGGVYECRAVSVTGASAAISARVTVVPGAPSPPSMLPAPATAPPPGGVVRQENTTTLWPLLGGPCPLPAFCLNGGTCTYYETLGELVCQCAEGYKGRRCENKDVYNGGTPFYPSPLENPSFPHPQSYSALRIPLATEMYTSRRRRLSALPAERRRLCAGGVVGGGGILRGEGGPCSGAGGRDSPRRTHRRRLGGGGGDGGGGADGGGGGPAGGGEDVWGPEQLRWLS